MLNIKSVFFPSDRLDELKEIPRLSSGEIDYWECAKILCEKDGGHLPNLTESKELIEWLYEDNNEDSPKVERMGFTDLEGYKINKSKANSINLKNWDDTNITDNYVDVYLWLSTADNSRFAYGRHFFASNMFANYYSRGNSILQAVCVGD